jgi:hypothetical protein
MAKAAALNAAVSKRRESMGISSDIFWSGAGKVPATRRSFYARAGHI